MATTEHIEFVQPADRLCTDRVRFSQWVEAVVLNAVMCDQELFVVLRAVQTLEMKVALGHDRASTVMAGFGTGWTNEMASSTSFWFE